MIQVSQDYEAHLLTNTRATWASISREIVHVLYYSLFLSFRVLRDLISPGYIKYHATVYTTVYTMKYSMIYIVAYITVYITVYTMLY